MKYIAKKNAWVPPLKGYFKLNIYGAMFFNLHHTGIGAVLRDSKWNCIMAANIYDDNAINSEIVEAATILKGLHQCMLFVYYSFSY